MGSQVTLARPRRCGAKAWLERQSKMGARASARVAKAKGGLASSFGHDHKGIRRFEVAHVKAVLHGLRMEAGRGRWHGAERQLAWSALQRPAAHAQGGNGRWTSCLGGLGSVL
jgi:hypothetical protein